MAARDLNHSYVGTEHLLIGVLKVEQCAAAKRLLAAGLTLDKLVAAINPVIPSFDGLSGITDLAEVNKSLSASLITQDRNGKWVMRVPGEGYLYVEDLTAIVAELTAMAKWCCLMTGSSDLDTAACPCGSAAECYCTVEERAELSQVPHVQAAKASKSAYFNSVREKKE